MAKLISIATGDFTTAGTWATVAEGTAGTRTDYLDSENTAVTSQTTYQRDSSGFQPGAITIDGIAIKINKITSAAGTVSVELYNLTGAAQIGIVYHV